jgi:hypothetical protein
VEEEEEVEDWVEEVLPEDDSDDKSVMKQGEETFLCNFEFGSRGGGTGATTPRIEPD